MVTCQSANQLKTPANVSWAFKMVSHFGSLGYTIMGKTADLTVVQKTIIDTLHKEGKPQTFIAKEADCSQSAVSKHVNRKLSGRKKCGRKRCTINRENSSLMRIVKQNRFNLGELHKEWTEAGVKASRATTHRRVKEFSYSCHQRRLTWAKEEKNWTVAQWPKVLFSDESKFCISFVNQGPSVWMKDGEAHSTSCLKSSVKLSVFGWDVKPRSWLSVVIKNPMALLVKSRGVTPVSWPNTTTSPYQSWPPNNPHPLDWLNDSLFSPPVAGV